MGKDNEHMKPWRRTVYSLGLAIGGLVFAFQIWQGYQAVTRNAFVIPYLPLIGLAWGMVVVAFALQFAAWAALMRGLGVFLKWREVIWGYPLSFLPRYLPGSIWGYLSRSEWLWRSYKVGYSISGTGTILEILAALSALGLVAGVYLTWVSTGVARLVYCVLTIVFLPASLAFLCLIGKIPFLQRFLSIQTLMRSSSLKTTSGYWIASVILNFSLWLCYGGVMSLVARGFGLQNIGNLVDYTFLFGFAWLAGFLVVFVPSGLGVREVALSNLLTSKLGIPAVQASALSVMSRFVISLAELAWILVALRFKNGQDQSQPVK